MGMVVSGVLRGGGDGDGGIGVGWEEFNVCLYKEMGE